MADKFPDWFSITAKPNFEQFLIPLAGVDYLHFLQLGAYTGDASVWMLDNILTGEGSRLTDVDTWQGSDEEVHKKLDFNEVYNTYLYKTAEYELQVSIKRMTTTEYLLSNRSEQFDFIYVDADHTAASALIDAELSWGLLKSGGILAFDDYTWGSHLPAHLAPKLGINLFIHRYQGKFENLIVNGQVWLRKL